MFSILSRIGIFPDHGVKSDWFVVRNDHGKIEEIRRKIRAVREKGEPENFFGAVGNRFDPARRKPERFRREQQFGKERAGVLLPDGKLKQRRVMKISRNGEELFAQDREPRGAGRVGSRDVAKRGDFEPVAVDQAGKARHSAFRRVFQRQDTAIAKPVVNFFAGGGKTVRVGRARVVKERGKLQIRTVGITVFLIGDAGRLRLFALFFPEFRKEIFVRQRSFRP